MNKIEQMHLDVMSSEVYVDFHDYKRWEMLEEEMNDVLFQWERLKRERSQ